MAALQKRTLLADHGRSHGRALAEPDVPEVELVPTLHGSSYFDCTTLDRTRQRFVDMLREKHRGQRLRVFCLVTQKGRFIIVHAKLTISGDELLRIGSASLNRRSTGADTECNLVVRRMGRGRKRRARRNPRLSAAFSSSPV